MEGGRPKASLSLNQGSETLRNVRITGSSISFDRAIGQGIVQRYTGTMRNGTSIRGAFTHQKDQYRWWAERKPPDVVLELTYPAGKSPKVFTAGWLFGAKCVVEGKDLSSKVAWSGTGTFKPSAGSTSRPSFSRAGANRIVLTVDANGQKVSRSFSVTAVSPENYAAVGDGAVCQADAHGCPACPHLVAGPILQGSPHVLVRGKPAARVGDPGTHGGQGCCCGPNTYKIVGGDPDVLIDGKPAARFGDETQHCGGMGKVCRLTRVPSAKDPACGPARLRS